MPERSTTISLRDQFDKALRDTPFNLVTTTGRESEPVRTNINKDYIRGTELDRVIHNYNEFGYSCLLFRFKSGENPEERLHTLEKLMKAYGFVYVQGSNGEYHKNDEITIGGMPAHLYVRCDWERGFVEVGIGGYRKESDALAIEKMGEFLPELEKVIRK